MTDEDDYDLGFGDFTPVTPISQPKVTKHGGAREGAGRKPKAYVKPKEVVDFEAARARNEAAKADQNELDFRIKSGQYVARSAVQQASAVAVSGMAQTLRSIRDNLEHRGVPLDVCEQVDAVIQEALDDMSKQMFKMSEGADDAGF